MYANDGLLFFYEYSDNITFCCNNFRLWLWLDVGILSVNLNNINLDNTNYEEDDPDTIVFGRILASHIEFQKHKELKES